MSVELTEEAEGQEKRMSEHKARQHFYLLAVDWVHLRMWLPTPPKKDVVRTQKTREYGHPAEWASDKAAEIAELFSSWHDLMAEHRNEKRPPTGAEQVRVAAAWQYLEPRLTQLVELVDAEALQEVVDLHYRIKGTLGLTKRRDMVPIPCPNDSDCESAYTLERVVGVGHDFIACSLCNYTIRDEHYRLLVRIALDSVLDESAAGRMGVLMTEALLLISGRESTTVVQVMSRLNTVRASGGKPKVDPVSVRAILSRLVKAGHIQRLDRGVYAPTATLQHAS